MDYERYRQRLAASNPAKPDPRLVGPDRPRRKGYGSSVLYAGDRMYHQISLEHHELMAIYQLVDMVLEIDQPPVGVSGEQMAHLHAYLAQRIRED